MARRGHVGKCGRNRSKNHNQRPISAPLPMAADHGRMAAKRNFHRRRYRTYKKRLIDRRGEAEPSAPMSANIFPHIGPETICANSTTIKSSSALPAKPRTSQKGTATITQNSPPRETTPLPHARPLPQHLSFPPPFLSVILSGSCWSRRISAKRCSFFCRRAARNSNIPIGLYFSARWINTGE